MLLRGSEFVAKAASRPGAVPGFVAYNLESAEGIVAAAERSRTPVILQTLASGSGYVGGRALGVVALDLAEHADVAIGVHLDHSRSLEEIMRFLELGYSSVMVDGSALPFSENVALTRSVVSRAHAKGAWVEGELGGIGGSEDGSGDMRGGTLTEPEQAAEFVDATGVDALAVSVGNVHGLTRLPVKIDLERLSAIGARTEVPLVLHGASGLDEASVLECVAGRVGKINVNAELRAAYVASFTASVSLSGRRDNLADALRAAQEAVAGAALRVVRLVRAPEEGHDWDGERRGSAVSEGREGI